MVVLIKRYLPLIMFFMALLLVKSVGAESTATCSGSAPPATYGVWNVSSATICTNGMINVGNNNVSVTNVLTFRNITLFANGINITGTVNCRNCTFFPNTTTSPFALQTLGGTGSFILNTTYCYNCTFQRPGGMVGSESILVNNSVFYGGKRPFVNLNGATLRWDNVTVINASMGSGMLIDQFGQSGFTIKNSFFYAENQSGNYVFFNSSGGFNTLTFDGVYLEGFRRGIYSVATSQARPVTIAISNFTCTKSGICISLCGGNNITVFNAQITNNSDTGVSFDGFCGGRMTNITVENVYVETTKGRGVSAGRAKLVKWFNLTTNLSGAGTDGAVQLDQSNDSLVSNVTCYNVNRACVMNTEAYNNTWSDIWSYSQSAGVTYGQTDNYRSIGAEVSGSNVTIQRFFFNVTGMGIRYSHPDSSLIRLACDQNRFLNGSISNNWDASGSNPIGINVENNCTGTVFDNIVVSGCKAAAGDYCEGVGNIWNGGTQNNSVVNFTNMIFNNITRGVATKNMTSGLFTFINTSWHGSYSTKVYTIHGANLVFINATGLGTSLSDINISDSVKTNVYVGWALKSLINYTNETPVSFANVSFLPPLFDYPFTYLNLTTDANGLTNESYYVEWKKNNTNVFNYTPQSVNISVPNNIHKQNNLKTFSASQTLQTYYSQPLFNCSTDLFSNSNYDLSGLINDSCLVIDAQNVNINCDNTVRLYGRQTLNISNSNNINFSSCFFNISSLPLVISNSSQILIYNSTITNKVSSGVNTEIIFSNSNFISFIKNNVSLIDETVVFSIQSCNDTNISYNSIIPSLNTMGINAFMYTNLSILRNILVHAYSGGSNNYGFFVFENSGNKTYIIENNFTSTPSARGSVLNVNGIFGDTTVYGNNFSSKNSVMDNSIKYIAPGADSNNLTINNNSLSTLTNTVSINSVNNMSITNNLFLSDAGTPFFVSFSKGVVFNNYFRGILNITLNTNNIVWNTTKILNTNIIGGQYLGGNYYETIAHKGYSETCLDSTHDGFCEVPYVLDVSNTDFAPLAASNFLTFNVTFFDSYIGKTPTVINGVPFNFTLSNTSFSTTFTMNDVSGGSVNVSRGVYNLTFEGRSYASPSESRYFSSITQINISASNQSYVFGGMFGSTINFSAVKKWSRSNLTFNITIGLGANHGVDQLNKSYQGVGGNLSVNYGDNFNVTSWVNVSNFFSPSNENGFVTVFNTNHSFIYNLSNCNYTFMVIDKNTGTKVNTSTVRVEYNGSFEVLHVNTVGNASFFLEQGISFTVSVNASGYGSIVKVLDANASQQLYIFNMSSTNASLINLEVFDESTGLRLTQSADVAFISKGFVFNTSLIGNISLNNVIAEDYEIRYSSLGFTPRFYYLKLANSTEYDVNLYLLSSSLATNFHVVVYDQSRNVLNNATVKTLRYITPITAYDVVSMVKTDTVGESNLDLVKFTIPYQFIIDYNGVTRLISTPNILSSQTNNLEFYLQLDDDVFAGFRTELNVTSMIFDDNETYNVTMTYSDPRNSILSGSLVVYRRDSFSNDKICDITLNSSSGTIKCPYNNVSGSYQAYSFIHTNTTHSSFYTNVLTFEHGVELNIPAIMGRNGLFFALFFMIIPIILLTLASPVIAIVLTLVVVVASMAIGMWSVSAVYVVTLCIIGYIVLRRTNQ